MFWELQNITRSLQGCKEFLQIYITEMIHVWAHLQLESEMVHSHRHMALVIHGRRTLGAATFTLYRGGISTVENKRRNFFFTCLYWQKLWCSCWGEIDTYTSLPVSQKGLRTILWQWGQLALNSPCQCSQTFLASRSKYSHGNCVLAGVPALW